MKTLISKGSTPISVDRWSMPVIPELYDRTPELSAVESAAIDYVVHCKFPKPETVRGIRLYRDLERLLRPLQDVLSVTKPPCRRIHITVLSFMMREMWRRQQSFWGWSIQEWSEMVTPNGHAFLKQTGRRPDIRKHLIAISYLLCGYSEFYRIGQLQQPLFAASVFGKEIIDQVIERVSNELRSWGYTGPKISKGYLPNALCEALLVNRSPRLEDLTYEFLARLRQSDIADTHKETIYYISRVLKSFGMLKEALPTATVMGRSLGDSGALEGASSEWVDWCQRWHKTTTLAPDTANRYRYALLAVGRWLTATHPEIVSPEQWTRELGAEYVAEVCRMTACQWTQNTTCYRRLLGKPLGDNAKNTKLMMLRTFFDDCQEWGWIPRRFDPRRSFATPRSVKAQIGPAPRVIVDEVWAKLQWAGLNLAKDDLPMGPNGEGSHYPVEMIRAMALVWLFCALRNNEFKRLRCGCIRYLPEDVLVNGTSQSVSARRVCWLDVPTNKTGSSFTKPVDPAVGEVIQAWEKVRPAQPASIDHKTGEVVHFLFFYRGHKIGDAYLNDFLIPLLCRKAGIPETDARGTITSHRARATITSQLYNACEPMTLWELKEWLGHRYLSSTEYYLKTSPTKLAKAYQDAGYFERNRRMIDLLIDQEAVREGLVASDQLWKFYDLGHGYCAYDFFDKCPHRMACARCDFYIPKESARAQMIEGKTNLVRLKQEIPLTDEEVAAVDDGILLMGKLCEKLADVPTPSGPTPRELRVRSNVYLPIK